MANLTPEQQTMKEQGNSALSGGDATRALELFTKAIDVNGGNSEGRAVLFSNRAAAYMLLKDFDSALEDADSCIRLDSDFAKGWGRKGAALHGLRKFKEAAEVYRAASTKAKTPEQTEEYRKQADKCEAEASAPPSTSSFPASGAASSSTPIRPMTTLSPLVTMLRVLSFLLAFSWFFTADAQYYGMSMLLMGISSVIAIVEAIGRPRMTTEYAERFLQHQIKPFFLLPVVYSSMPPTPPAIFNTQLIAIGTLARNLQQYLRKASPTLADKVGQRVSSSAVLGRLAGVPNWQSMSVEERFSRFDYSMEQICSRFELAVMAILLLQLFTPAGNYISVLIYPQVLKLRYLTNEPTRTSIHNLDYWLSDLGQRYPIAGKVYAPIRTGVVWFGTQGIRNAANRPRNAQCNIM